METKNYTVFLDFDNTITKLDVIDDMLIRFSKDDRWVELEKKWKDGLIGSRDCLRGQIGGIRITRRDLDQYLSGVGLDTYFKRLMRLFKSKNIKTVILSDNFDYILKKILKTNGLSRLKTHSNKLKVSKNRLVPYFPSTNKDCARSCGHCKNRNLSANAGKGSRVVYIGDGLSDACPSKHADLVFAKDELQKYLKTKKLPHIPIKGLKDVYEYFKTI